MGHRKSSAQSLAVMASLLEQTRIWRHGYALSKATGLRSGTLYPILARLQDRGYLESKWVEPAHAGRPPRHVFRLTSTGARHAREVVSEQKYARRLRPDGVKA
jgi:DNA-binding PadR family transcriptional regulator